MDPILTPEDIAEFRTIWREEFGEELPMERAAPVAERFLSALHQIISLAERPDETVSTVEQFDGTRNEMVN